MYREGSTCIEERECRPAVAVRGRKGLSTLLLVGLLLLGAWIRVQRLSTEYLWADEAESSINALTILERGYPAHTYLGIPIYENTLTEPWPEHPEYEFKDSSYSSRGAAVYHGWFPLYAIAASFAAAGITSTPPEDDSERERRTFFARLPSVIFGVGLLVAVYLAARSLYGIDAAWAALIIASLSPAAVGASRQARYYAATLLLGVLCGMAVWRMTRRARWRDVVVGGVLFVLLFHTHLLTFGALGILLAAGLWRYRAARLRDWPKFAVFAAILTAGILPWVLWTGMLERAAAVPKVWPLLELRDVIGFPLAKLHYTALVAAGLLLLAVRGRLRGDLARRLAPPLYTARDPYLFTFTWLMAAYGCFLVLTPAASFFQNRMSTILGGPGMLITAMLFAIAGRTLAPRHSTLVAALLAAAFVIALRVNVPAPERDHGLTAVLDHLRQVRLEPGTRLYATPSDHLVLTFYSGIPIQSTAPVRKSFFDAYPGRILIFESLVGRAGPDSPAGAAGLVKAAAGAGVKLTPAAAEQLAGELAAIDFRAAVEGRVRSVQAPAADLPPFALAALEWQHRANRRHLEAARNFAASVPISRGFPIRRPSDLGCVFFYRFVDPHSRCGPNLNFAQRLKTADARLIAAGWAVYDSPPIGPPDWRTEECEHPGARVLTAK